MIKTVTIYESASTDGYTSSGDGVYFLTAADASKYSVERHRGHSITPIEHSVVGDNGRYYLLKRSNPVAIYQSEQYKRDVAQQGLRRLTKEQREALNLPDPD